VTTTAGLLALRKAQQKLKPCLGSRHNVWMYKSKRQAGRMSENDAVSPRHYCIGRKEERVVDVGVVVCLLVRRHVLPRQLVLKNNHRDLQQSIITLLSPIIYLSGRSTIRNRVAKIAIACRRLMTLASICS